MGEMLVQSLKMALRVAVIAGIVAAVAAVFVLVTQALAGVITLSVVGEFAAMIQIWLPFNLGQTILYLGTLVVAFQTFRLARWANERVNMLIGR